MDISAKKPIGEIKNKMGTNSIPVRKNTIHGMHVKRRRKWKSVTLTAIL